MWKPMSEAPKDIESFLVYKPTAKKYKTILAYPKGEDLFDASGRRITDATMCYVYSDPQKERA